MATTDTRPLLGYQRIIFEIDPTVNPAGVEASMRLEYGTLDHLDRATFAQEIEIAKDCERTEPGYLRQIAESYGLARDFERAEPMVKNVDLRVQPRLFDASGHPVR